MAMNIYYYHSLDFTFTSAQTLQIVKDYAYISQRGYTVFLYGSYRDINTLKEIEDFLVDFPNMRLYAVEYDIFKSIKVGLCFFLDIVGDKKEKIVVTRHFKKLQTLLRLKFFLRNIIHIHEMHEESFVYRFKKLSKTLFLKILNNVDIVLFTNPSQLLFFQKEFESSPDFFYMTLPNGVESLKFKNAMMQKNKVITYLGQLNSWKNPELLFETLTYLPQPYAIRIAGGKGDVKSQLYIDNLIEKYKLEGRVKFLGFIKNEDVVSCVLDGSNILFLPLGNNIQSCYLTSPMKLFEYIATKIPVLTVECPSISSLVSKNEVFFTTNNAKVCAEKIMQITAFKNKEMVQKKIINMNQKSLQYSYANRSRLFDENIQDYRVKYNYAD